MFRDQRFKVQCAGFRVIRFRDLGAYDGLCSVCGASATRLGIASHSPQKLHVATACMLAPKAMIWQPSLALCIYYIPTRTRVC